MRPRSPVSRLLLISSLLVLSCDPAGASDRLDEVDLVQVPDMLVPPYLAPVIDPVFGSRIIRVTDPGRDLLPGVACDPAYCRHRYSSTQAWNSDQSLLVISKGCGGLCFLDGQSYVPLFHRRPPGTCEWHPGDPALMICVSATGIHRWDVHRDVLMPIFLPSGYGRLEFGPGKNNLSRDGGRLVVRATDARGAMVAFAYDIPSRTKFPDIHLAGLEGENSYCTISPSGEYVFCFQRLPDDTNTGYVFAVEGTVVQHWPENHRPGHGDMTIDIDGADVLVGISKADPDQFQVIKRRLADGEVTVLTPRGLAQHASIRNTGRPGWVFLTYGGNRERASRQGTLPLYQEIVALSIDGSGDMIRIAHTRAEKHDYLSEAQASPSPDGSQVIWASNWGRPGGSVAAYVARPVWPEQ